MCGQNCDKGMLRACSDAVKDDGRVSLDEAKKVFAQIKDGDEVTQMERWTLRHCLLAFKWKHNAQDWILDQCKKLQHAGKYTDAGPPLKKLKADPNDPKETVDGVVCDGGIMEAC